MQIFPEGIFELFIKIGQNLKIPSGKISMSQSTRLCSLEQPCQLRQCWKALETATNLHLKCDLH
jgi:hypothetical protein